MLTADGGFVMAVPDQRQFKKHVASKPRTLTGAEVREQQPTEAELTCLICKKLVWEAVRTPCCQTSYCEECIQIHLLDRDFECPSCESKIPSLSKLEPALDLRQRVKLYVDGEVERSAREEREDREQEEAEAKLHGGDGTAMAKAEEGVVHTLGEVTSGTITAPTQTHKLDPAKLQEMLNPQTMQAYMTQITRMMQNPQVGPQARALLQAQVQMVQTGVMQMQMLAATNMMGREMGMPIGGNMMPNGPNFNGAGGMDMNGSMGMGMGGNGEGFGMGMGMNGGNLGMGMQGGGNMGGGRGRGGRGFGPRGRGGFNPNGRNLPIPQVRPPKRQGEEFEGYPDKQQRVS
ncbi:hypothetical protein M231_06996 [Tremella mesenterica]|uniref:RING-type domain-containing protein n=1 Tax=Tremella mesenterica TaxID=5217 RepID=A0A4Q1BER1_TREME|nr:hypothetical protein M231_06996 [Tremella mesenterica]